MNRLRELLEQIDGRGYKAYKQLVGSYDFDGFRLSIDHVQIECLMLLHPAQPRGAPVVVLGNGHEAGDGHV